MNTENKVELYKTRSIGERFSAAGDFVRQNWKVMLKNIGYIGVPLAIVQGYFMQNYVTGSFDAILNPDDYLAGFDWINYSLILLFSSILGLFLYSMTGAILYQYSQGKLTTESGWNELKGDMFSIMGKIFVQGVILSLAVALICGVLGVVIGLAAVGSPIFSGVISVILILVLLAALVFIMPPLCMIVYPVFFEKTSAWQGIKKGVQLGIRNWGSVFLTLFLGGMLASIVYYLIAMPYFVHIMMTTIEGEASNGIMGYIASSISTIGMVIIYPLFTIFLAFQYTSIVEKEEGVSLQDKIDDFDQL